MCGIIGAINAAYNSIRSSDFIKDAILAGAVRGQDSTGIIQVDKKDSIYTHKLALSGTAFLRDKVTAAFVADTDRSPITVVHHRAATVGAVNKDNAHPFICEMGTKRPDGKPHVLVGVHNGSLINWKTKPGAKDYEVDSEWALSRIAAVGLEAFKEIEGPYCFMWVSSDNVAKLNVVRNGGRPMHAVFTKDRKEVFFASEAGMLAWLCERNNVSVEENILVIGTDKVYTFDTSGAVVTVTATDVPKKPAVVPVTQPSRPHGSTSTADSNPVLNADGQAFINKLKLAAKGQLHVAPAPRPNMPTQQEIAAAIDKTIADITDDGDSTPWNNDDEGFFVPDQVPTDWFSGRNATNSEQELAKKWGMFQELQWFAGVTYDDQTGEVLGDVDVWSRDEGKVKYAAVIRGCSQARANAEYIDNDLGKQSSVSGNWVVVIGAREEKQLGKVLVVAELNQAGRAGLEKMAAKNH